jgi:hypothetical protein
MKNPQPDKIDENAKSIADIFADADIPTYWAPIPILSP